MLTSKKFFIAYKNGRYCHRVFPTSWMHEQAARDYGFDYFGQVIETGFLIGCNSDKTVKNSLKISLEVCKRPEHLKHRQRIDLNEITALRLSREAQTRYAYMNKESYILREGD